MTTFWERFQRGRPPAVTVGELYAETDALVDWLAPDLPPLSECQSRRAASLRALSELVASLRSNLSPLQAQNVTLTILREGILAGLSHGFIAARTEMPLPSLSAFCPNDELAPPFQKLERSLERVAGTASSEWTRMEVEDLELLAEYGRHQNLGTLEEAALLPDGLKFQEFLLGAFKSGFAIGLIQTLLAPWARRC